MRVAELFEGLENFPEHFMLRDGFYAEKKPPEDDDAFDVSYKVYQLMDENLVAIAAVTLPESKIYKNSWVFRHQVFNASIESVQVSEKDLHNFLKFKWWLWNMLVKCGAVADAKRVSESDQGQYKNDTAERAMIHKIVDLACNQGLLKGGKTEANLEKAYDFLESDWGGRLWDKHYELFHQMHPNFEGPFNRGRYKAFKRDAEAWLKAWKNDRKLPKDVKPLEKMHEAADPKLTLPKLISGWPGETVIPGTAFSIHRVREKAANKARFEVRRLMDDPEADPEGFIYVVKRGRGSSRSGQIIWQCQFGNGEQLPWDKRSEWVKAEEAHDFKKFTEFIKRVLANQFGEKD